MVYWPSVFVCDINDRDHKVQQYICDHSIQRSMLVLAAETSTKGMAANAPS